MYREQVDPPRGGTSPETPITFESHGDGRTVLTGADPLTGWTQVEGEVWTAEADNRMMSTRQPVA